MEIGKYQEIAYRSYFGKLLSRKEQLINNALGLTGEAGEVVDQIKKELYLKRDISDEEVMEELGDVLWHLCCLASARGISMEDVAAYNISKLKRRYKNADWGQDTVMGSGGQE